MNLIKKITIIGILLTTGCSTTDKIGTVGNYEFYKVHGSQFVGPNFTALVSRDTNSQEVRIEYVFGSAGIGTAVIAAGGNIAASAAFGASLPNSGDTVNVNGGNSYANSSSKNLNNNNNSNKSKNNIDNNSGGGNSGGGKHNHGSHGEHTHTGDNNSHKDISKSYFRGLSWAW